MTRSVAVLVAAVAAVLAAAFFCPTAAAAFYANHTCLYGAGSYHFPAAWLVKTDSNGNEQWNETFGGDGQDFVGMVQQTTDSGYVIAGATGSYGAGDFDAWLIKLSPDGATDPTPPTLPIASPAPNTTTQTPTITIAGTASDASGIASVTVNGEPVNGTLNWSANVTLTVGDNTITVIATDGAGLTTTKTITVYRIEPFTFVHITDVHLGYWPSDNSGEKFPLSIEKFTDTLQSVKLHNPEFILSPGDLVEYSNNDFFDAYMGLLESLNVPVYNTPGNHDRRGWNPLKDVGLTAYDGIVVNPSNIESLDDGYRDYYFDKHGYRLIGLDTGADYNVSVYINPVHPLDFDYDSSPEGDGLNDTQLTNLSEMPSGMPKIIFMHHPAIDASDDAFVEGASELPVSNSCPEEHGGNDASIAFNRCGFVDYCINNTVDLVLTGHTHRDYIATVSDDLDTHKTQFIQTRSATKDPDIHSPDIDHHGYRVIKIAADTDRVKSYNPYTTEWTNILERYTFVGNVPNGACYVEKGDDTTGTDKNGNVLREIPNTYYTEPLGSEYQVIVYYLFKNGEPDDWYLCKKKPVDDATSSISTSQTTLAQESTGSITISHRTENVTIKYIYENITLGAAENATAGVNFSSENTNCTMEFDDDGDGTTDSTIDPTHILINYAPNVSITTPAEDQSGNVTILYNLKDAESDNCTIMAQYRLDNITWIDATMCEGGDGMINLASTPLGVDHTFMWSSGTDIPQTNATVYFRIRPYDRDLAGAYATTGAFSVDNSVSGDLNRDGYLTPTDAAIALAIAVGSRPFNDAADVSRDGKVTSLDALMLLQAAAGDNTMTTTVHSPT